MDRLRYEVRLSDPGRHLFQVRLQMRGVQPGEHVLELPAWTPGSYRIRDFARHVVTISAANAAGEPVPLRKVRKSRWVIEAPRLGEDVEISYLVYADELSVRGCHVDETHLFYNGACLFLQVDGKRELPATVILHTPPGWQVSTGLDVKALDAQGQWELSALDYDTLLDSPVEAGMHARYFFSVGGVPHELAVYGEGNLEAARLLSDLPRIVEAAAQIFGGLPYHRYVFLLHLTDGPSGGLEHRNSAVCALDRWSFRPESRYLRSLTLFSHEFFHLWNVKRIHPDTLGPFDYSQENYTTLLWAMEGITDYYADLLACPASASCPRGFPP